MALTAQQRMQVAAYWINTSFVAANMTANFNTDDVTAAVTAIDNAFDATLNAAVTAVGGATSVINGLNQIIPAPFSAASTQQKTLIVCHTLMKRAGLL